MKRLTLGMTLLLLLAFGISTAHGSEIIYDITFVDEPLGPLTEIEGVRLLPTDPPEVVEQPSRSGKSVRIDGAPDRAKTTLFYVLPEPVTDTLTVETWLYPVDDVNRNIALSVSDDAIYGSTDAVSLYLHSNGSIRYFDTTWHVLDVQYRANEWIHIKVVLDIPAQTYDIYVNDMENKVATAPFRNPKTEITRVGFFSHGYGTSPQPVYVDSLLIRK